MKHDIIQTAKIVLIGAIFSVGVSYVFSGYWENAGAIPEGGNTSEVVTLLDGEQHREGSFLLDTDADNAKLSTDVLTVNTISYFGSKVDIGKKFVGGVGGGEGGFGVPASTLDTDLSVTGDIGVNIGGLEPGASLHVNGDVKIRPLGAEVTGEKATVCADTDGTLILCPPEPELVGIVSGPTVTNQEHIPQGGGTDNCTADVSFSASATGGDWPYSYSWRVRNDAGISIITINDVTLSPAGTWRSVGTGSTVMFEVFAKDPGDAWSIELTTTDDAGTVHIANSSFGIWSIGGCN